MPGRALRLARAVALASLGILAACEDPCVLPLEQWCGDPPCEELTALDATISGQCDGLAVAHDFTIDSYVTNVWYFEPSTSKLVAVHVYSDDPIGSCESNWYGARVTCEETCELTEDVELLECAE